MQERNLQRRPCSVTLTALLFAIATCTLLLLFQEQDPVWSRREEVRNEMPTPLSCLPPLQVGQRASWGSSSSCHPLLSELASNLKQGEVERKAWGQQQPQDHWFLGPLPPEAQSTGCSFSLPEFGRIYRDKINLTLNSLNVIYGLASCVLQHVWLSKIW